MEKDMRAEWDFEKKCDSGKVVETAKVVYYGGVTLCFIGSEQRRFTSPDAAKAELAIEGFVVKK